MPICLAAGAGKRRAIGGCRGRSTRTPARARGPGTGAARQIGPVTVIGAMAALAGGCPALTTAAHVPLRCIPRSWPWA